MRTSTITTRGIHYYKWEQHGLHVTLAKRKQCGTHYCRVYLVKLALKGFWWAFGWALLVQEPTMKEYSNRP
jgi:hypothetical protein